MLTGAVNGENAASVRQLGQIMFKNDVRRSRHDSGGMGCSQLKFGEAIALSGDGKTLAIGGNRTADIDYRTSGSLAALFLYSYSQSQNRWVPKGKIGISFLNSYSLALSFSGDVLAVGAATYFYEKETDEWQSVGMNGDVSAVNVAEEKRKAYCSHETDSSHPEAHTAVSLSADGKTLAIGGAGVPCEYGCVPCGMVSVYQLEENGQEKRWLLVARGYGDPKARLGSSVSLSSDGTVLAASQFMDSVPVCVWKYTFPVCNLQTVLLSPSPGFTIRASASTAYVRSQIILRGKGGYGGYRTVISGDGKTIAEVGRPEAFYAVRVFREKAQSWEQLGQNIPGKILHYSPYIAKKYSVYNCNQPQQNSWCLPLHSTSPVTLSDDGNVLAVARISDDEGYVSVFKYKGGDWIEVLGEKDNSLLFGYSVALSADGQILAVNSTLPGLVRVFELKAC